MKKAFTIITVILILTSVIIPTSTKAAESDLKAGIVNIESGWLNVRKEPTAASETIAKLNKSDYLTLITKTGNWWYVEYSDRKYGYCSSSYISVVSSNIKYVNIKSGTLNVRSKAGTESEIIGSLTKGESILQLSTVGNWSYILYNGNKTGYVSTWYISDRIIKYPSLKLSVPSYKQTDQRWANVKLGTSGKTIKDIGCATTGIAMMESYRLGYNIYPDAMSKKLKYTSSGSVYWPSHFYQITSKTDYLSKIYSILESGKPVLLGAKNRYGSQHWVVITGYLGGDSLTASGFTVNDPGSKTRTTLQDLFNTHPTFYKYLYY